MTAYIVFGLVGFVLVAWLALTSLAERTADWRKRRGIRRSGRAAAKARHPVGKQQPVYDQETDQPVPPSDEVRDHGQGKSVADAAAADLIRIHIENMWNMPDARKEARP